MRGYFHKGLKSTWRVEPNTATLGSELDKGQIC